MSLNRPIGQTSIVDEVIARITDSLIKGELRPGGKLPSEMELCRILGIGRNSLREAIKMLTALGVLQVKRGDGTYVSTSVPPSMLDPLLFSLILQRGTPYELFELRAMFEIAAVELAAEKATPDDIRQCEAAVDELEKAFMAKNKNLDLLLQLDLAFHYAVLGSCHNPLIERIGHTILRLYMGSISQALVIDPAKSVANHRKIATVIKDRTPALARQVVTDSLSRWRAILTREADRK